MKKLICMLVMLCLLAPCALAQMPVAVDDPYIDPVVGQWKLAMVCSPDLSGMQTPAEAEMDMLLDFAWDGKVSLTSGEKTNSAEWARDKDSQQQLDQLGMLAEMPVGEDTGVLNIRYGREEMQFSLIGGRLYWGAEDALLVFTPDGAFVPGMQPDPAIGEFFGYWECESYNLMGVAMDAAEGDAMVETTFQPLAIEDDEPALCKIGDDEYDKTTYGSGLLRLIVGSDDKQVATLCLLEDGSIQVDLFAGMVSARYVRAEAPAEPTEVPAEEVVEATDAPAESSPADVQPEETTGAAE